MIKKNSSENDLDSNSYLEFVSKKVTTIMILVVIVFILSIFAMSQGAYKIPFFKVIETVFGGGDDVEHVVIWNIRLPIIVASILIGSSLALSGTIMQCVMKNPLASPYTLGISSAASFGAALAIAGAHIPILTGSFMGDLLNGPYGISIIAFSFAMIAVGIVLAFSRTVNSNPESMVLIGVALGSIFSAALSSLQYFVPDSTLSSLVYWQFGDLSKAEWNELKIILAIFIPILLYVVFHRLDYNAMSAGEEVAQSLGINTKRLTILTMTLSSALAAVCISFVGIIGFIGLLGPHIMRRIVGNDHRFLIPASMLMGTFVLLASDSLGRLAFDTVIPVGIITSFLGGPLFLYILITNRRRAA